MRAPRALSALVVLVPVAACATLGTDSPEAQNLPTSDVGPFRALGPKEVPGVAPYVLDGADAAQFREPSALALDADPGSTNVALYFGAQIAAAGAATSHGAIVRSRAGDAVSFYGTILDTGSKPVVVLDESEPWEGGNLASPSVVHAGATYYLYYAAAGGIGVATSSDGLTFQKQPAPVLAADPSVRWETTTPAQPSVARFPDGTWHMLYAAGVSIGEATSADGLAWARADGDPSTPGMDPVLSPSPPASAAAIDAGTAPFDTGQVADPCLVPRLDGAGKIQVRVLYTGYAAPPGASSRASAIGFAARYGDSGALSRNGSPVYAVNKHPGGPALFEWSQGAMLYVNQDSPSPPVYTAIAAAVAPVALVLPAPGGYASSP